MHFFWSKMGHFRRFGTKNKERLSRGLDVKWHIPSACLDAFRVAMTRKLRNPLKWPKNVHGFQDGKPICHIVPVLPVSRA